MSMRSTSTSTVRIARSASASLDRHARVRLLQRALQLVDGARGVLGVVRLVAQQPLELGLNHLLREDDLVVVDLVVVIRRRRRLPLRLPRWASGKAAQASGRGIYSFIRLFDSPTRPPLFDFQSQYRKFE